MESVILDSNESKRSKGKIPVIISWGKNKQGNPAKMVRNHSIKFPVHEILKF